MYSSFGNCFTRSSDILLLRITKIQIFKFREVKCSSVWNFGDMTKTSVPSDKNMVLSYSILQILKKTYRGLLIAPKPPRPRYPRPPPRMNPPRPRPRGGLLLVEMPALFVRFGSTLICLPLKMNQDLKNRFSCFSRKGFTNEEKQVENRKSNLPGLLRKQARKDFRPPSAM